MDPTDALSIHLAWKLALRHAVATGVAANLDPDALGRADRCELGLWLESPLACAEGIAELSELHRRFHQVAGDLVRLIRDGGARDAIARTEVRLEDLSADLVARLGTQASVASF